MGRTRIEVAILLIALIGVAASAYAITLHYAASADSFCNIGDTFNCDKVNKSPWSTLFGIPVSILGTITYLAVFLIVLKKRAVKRFLSFTDKDFSHYFLFLIAVMFLFQTYLTLAEIFWIYAYCIVCLVSQLCTLALLVLAMKEYRK